MIIIRTARYCSKAAPTWTRPPGGPDGFVFDTQRLQITLAGREVLENRRDAVKLRMIDRWLGGTHLLPDKVWRWNGENQRLVAPS